MTRLLYLAILLVALLAATAVLAGCGGGGPELSVGDECSPDFVGPRHPNLECPQ